MSSIFGFGLDGSINSIFCFYTNPTSQVLNCPNYKYSYTIGSELFFPGQQLIL